MELVGIEPTSKERNQSRRSQIYLGFLESFRMKPGKFKKEVKRQDLFFFFFYTLWGKKKVYPSRHLWSFNFFLEVERKKEGLSRG